MGADSNRCLRCSLHARVVAASSTYSRSLWLLTALSFRRRTDSCRLCTLLTARRFCRMAADRSHDSTFVVDDGRTSNDSLGRTVPAVALRSSASIFDQRSWALSVIKRSSEDCPVRSAPDFLLVSFYLG